MGGGGIYLNGDVNSTKKCLTNALRQRRIYQALCAKNSKKHVNDKQKADIF